MSKKQKKKNGSQGFQIKEEFEAVTKSKATSSKIVPASKENYSHLLIRDVLYYIFEFVDNITLIRISMVMMTRMHQITL